MYLDHAATTAVRPEVREAMAPYLDEWYGNPSGVHAVSRRAKNAMEAARERAAELIGAGHPLEIVFTGGGTEADNLAVAGTALAGGRKGGVVTSASEHEAVLETARFLERLGCPLTILPVDGAGRLDPAAVSAAVGPGTAVVSVMTANNETGVLQPVPEIAAVVRQAAPRAAVHTDAVQAFIAQEVTVAATRSRPHLAGGAQAGRAQGRRPAVGPRWDHARACSARRWSGAGQAVGHAQRRGHRRHGGCHGSGG